VIVKPKDLCGAYVGLHIGYTNGHLYFYCQSYRSNGVLRENSLYGKTLDCDHCFKNFIYADRIRYESPWSCRKIGSSAPVSRQQIKDMFHFITGTTDPRSQKPRRDKSGSAPSRARARGSCSGPVAGPSSAI